MILLKLIRIVRFQFLVVFLILLYLNFYVYDYVCDWLYLFSLIVLGILAISFNFKPRFTVVAAGVFLLFAYNSFIKGNILMMEKSTIWFYFFLLITMIIKITNKNDRKIK